MKQCRQTLLSAQYVKRIHRNNTNKEIYFCNEKIEHLNNIKFLVILIDCKLNWAEHIRYIKNKIAKSLGIIFKIRIFVDKHTLRNMYFTFIYPYLIYCIEVWGNANEMQLTTLVKIQKKSIRLITLSHNLDHTEPLFERLNILN